MHKFVNFGADMKMFPTPIVALDKRPFLVGSDRRRRMTPTLAARRVFAQMSIRMAVR
jgi:hypothetical protein